jgi:hypothetical protein
MYLICVFPVLFDSRLVQGMNFFDVLFKAVGRINIIAEDLVCVQPFSLIFLSPGFDMDVEIYVL